MADSILSICNSALIKVGADRITAITENNRRAILCNEQYNKLRKEVLRAHPWNFAVHRVEIAQVADVEPASGYLYYYQLPNDCLRVLAINEEDDDDDWKIEGRYLATDESQIFIKYIKNITDTATFDAIFDEALACRMAADLAYPLTNSLQLSKAMFDAYDGQLRLARSMDGQEGSPDSLSATMWINARR